MTRQRIFFYLEKKCSVSTQTKSQYDRPSPEIPTRVTQICGFPCESMTICLFPWNRVDPALTVSYPDYGSQGPFLESPDN